MLARRRGFRVFAVAVAVSVGLAWGGRFEAHASSASATLYNEANALYRAARYPEAIERYAKALDAGLQNGYVYYNLANAYFKNNQVGKAILFYERALKLLPRDEDIETNLRFANLLKADKDPPSNTNPVLNLILGMHHALNPDEQAILCSALLFLVGAVAIMTVFSYSRRRSTFVTAIAILGAILVLSGVSLAAKIHAREFVETAIVMEPKVDAMSGPGDQYIKHFALHEGTKVVIERQSAGWCLIRLPNGLGGWLRADAVERI